MLLIMPIRVLEVTTTKGRGSDLVAAVCAKHLPPGGYRVSIGKGRGDKKVAVRTPTAEGREEIPF